jgi:DNA-binding NarL/FixJ family response regulator
METQAITKRQREIARGVVLGESVADVARRLGVREHSIHKALSTLYFATGTHSQVGLAGWCVAHGIVTVSELKEVYCSEHVDSRTEW